MSKIHVQLVAVDDRFSSAEDVSVWTSMWVSGRSAIIAVRFRCNQWKGHSRQWTSSNRRRCEWLSRPFIPSADSPSFNQTLLPILFQQRNICVDRSVFVLAIRWRSRSTTTNILCVIRMRSGMCHRCELRYWCVHQSSPRMTSVFFSCLTFGLACSLSR